VKNGSTSNLARQSPRQMLFAVTSSGVKLPVIVFDAAINSAQALHDSFTDAQVACWGPGPALGFLT